MFLKTKILHLICLQFQLIIKEILISLLLDNCETVYLYVGEKINIGANVNTA